MSRPFLWTSVLTTALLVTTEFWRDVVGGYHWSMPFLAFGLGILVEIRNSQKNLAEERQKFTINQFFDAEFVRLRAKDPTARLNIMLIQPLLSKHRLFSLRRARALQFFERIGFAEGDPDRNIVIYDRSGVAGMALHHKMAAIGMRDSGKIIVGREHRTYDDIECNMDQATRDQSRAADMRIIVSYPIRELRKDGVSVLDAGKVIGVINFDSKMAWSEWVKTLDAEDFINKRLPAMAKAVAYALA